MNADFVIRNVFPLQVIIFQQLPNLIFCIFKNPILGMNRINAQVRNFRRLTNRNIGNHDRQKKKSRFYSLSAKFPSLFDKAQLVEIYRKVNMNNSME